MRKAESTSLLPEGTAALCRLFEIAGERLQGRGIVLQSSPAVSEWLVDQSDWRSSSNPLRTLDASWHKQVASVIENLLLEGHLHQGNILSLSLDETSSSPQIRFDIAPRSKGEVSAKC